MLTNCNNWPREWNIRLQNKITPKSQQQTDTIHLKHKQSKLVHKNATEDV